MRRRICAAHMAQRQREKHASAGSNQPKRQSRPVQLMNRTNCWARLSPRLVGRKTRSQCSSSFIARSWFSLIDRRKRSRHPFPSTRSKLRKNMRARANARRRAIDASRMARVYIQRLARRVVSENKKERIRIHCAPLQGHTHYSSNNETQGNLRPQ